MRIDLNDAKAASESEDKKISLIYLETRIWQVLMHPTFRRAWWGLSEPGPSSSSYREALKSQGLKQVSDSTEDIAAWSDKFELSGWRTDVKWLDDSHCFFVTNKGALVTIEVLYTLIVTGTLLLDHQFDHCLDHL